MGNPDHMKIILDGDVDTWNLWRRDNLRVQPDLTRIDLSGRDLSKIDFRGVGLFKANLSGCNLSEAILRQSIAIKTDFTNANLSRSHIYGISAWDNLTDGAIQKDLVITEPNSPLITVDSIQIAQFIHLLINNKNIRDAIESIGKKSILILGRFTPERKEILNAIKDELRKRNYIPILFDFDKPSNRDITETLVTLAHLSKFIIADITDAKSIPQELSLVVPNLPSVKIKPIILSSQREYGMFEHFKRYPWVLPLETYDSKEDIVNNIDSKIIIPLENI
jgi:hypothetical protein